MYKTIASLMLATLLVVAGNATAYAARHNHGWHRVTSELADALAEGDAPDATTRAWERCVYRYLPASVTRRTGNEIVVYCRFDGYHETI